MHVMHMLPSASKQEIQVWISSSASDFSFFHYVVGILFVQAKDVFHGCSKLNVFKNFWLLKTRSLLLLSPGF